MPGIALAEKRDCLHSTDRRREYIADGKAQALRTGLELITPTLDGSWAAHNEGNARPHETGACRQGNFRRMADGGSVDQVAREARRPDGEGRASRGNAKGEGDGGKSFLHVEFPVFGSAGFRPAPSDRCVCPRFGRLHENTLHVSICRAFKQIDQILRNLTSVRKGSRQA
ncbi:hypothetical protein RHE_CH03248 [Rhizobium etli CFN 42]|uniref:Uncharacterized protein n=1 Tax=Rhizobium etli (strain ATCC 51251 / DSM 11541 / JCM 21823 / NBRC 15573 / CFN 42) TaxID=347834 RepID=Q2K574_RHIEC|nr:hypothetical protein RHE_CH03248 [Rhizobium etli CFN 42]